MAVTLLAVHQQSTAYLNHVGLNFICQLGKYDLSNLHDVLRTMKNKILRHTE